MAEQFFLREENDEGKKGEEGKKVKEQIKRENCEGWRRDVYERVRES